MRLLTEDPVLADELLTNYRRARLSLRDRSMLDFAVKMTTSSSTMTEADGDVLRKAGWADEAILEIAQVAAMFNFTNRLLDALGCVPNSEYHAMGR